MGWQAPTHRDEDTPGISAVTLSSEHTLVIMQHVVRLADAALLTGGGDFKAGALAVSLWVQAGRLTGGKAGGVVGVVWALQSCGEEEERLVERTEGSSEADAVKTQLDRTGRRASLPHFVIHSANIYGACPCAENRGKK